MSGMDLDTYQNYAATTANYKDAGNNLTYVALGLCGEAGEVAEKVKKHLRGDSKIMDGENENKRLMIAYELGDVLWYLARCASEIGYKLSYVAKLNEAKLNQRMLDGTLGVENRPPGGA